MSGKNEGVQSSTVPSPSRAVLAGAGEGGSACLGYKSSISSQSSDKNAELQAHVTSYSSNERMGPKGKQPPGISLALQGQKYELDDSSPASLQSQLQKIFSVCRLNEQTQICLKIIILDRVAESNPLFHPLLLDCYALYAEKTLRVMEERCWK